MFIYFQHYQIIKHFHAWYKWKPKWTDFLYFYLSLAGKKNTKMEQNINSLYDLRADAHSKT